MMYSSFDYGHMWGNPWMYGIGGGFAFIFGILALVLLAGFIALKGYALWCAAKRDEKWWFIALLIINTFGILEAVYIIFFVKKWHNRSVTHNHEHHHEGHDHGNQK